MIVLKRAQSHNRERGKPQAAAGCFNAPIKREET